MQILFLWSCFASFFRPMPQQSPQHNYFVIEGMHVSWEFEGEALRFSLHSPYQGWLGLGFNEANDVVNANMVMGAVANNTSLLEEYYVLGIGNQQPIRALGGQAAVLQYLGVEDNGGTNFEFTMDTSVQDAYHKPLAPGSEVWLICAYSMEDDFGHHSIMRRHVKVVL